jgi:hypothetical protein
MMRDLHVGNENELQNSNFIKLEKTKSHISYYWKNIMNGLAYIDEAYKILLWHKVVDFMW